MQMVLLQEYKTFKTLSSLLILTFKKWQTMDLILMYDLHKAAPSSDSLHSVVFIRQKRAPFLLDRLPFHQMKLLSEPMSGPGVLHRVQHFSVFTAEERAAFYLDLWLLEARWLLQSGGDALEVTPEQNEDEGHFLTDNCW